MYSLGQIEDALLARIREQLSYLATVDTYAGQIDFVQEELQITGVRFPAVLAMLQEEAGSPASKMSYDLTPTFRLLVCCRNLRGEQAARREDSGAYQILGDLKKALIDQKLGLAIEPVAYLKTEAMKISRDQVIYAVDFRLDYRWP